MPDTTRPGNGGDTPDRLQAFRAEYAKAGRKVSALDLLQLAVLVVGFAGLFALQFRGADHAMPESPRSNDFDRRLAAYLAEKNQPELALETYEKFLANATLPDDERARVCYSVAELALDLNNYSEALRYLYESELLDPNSKLAADIDKKIVLCLEKMGRSETLRRELRTRSGVQPPEVPADAVVLAEFAGEAITNLDLEREIEKLPASVRDSFGTQEQKVDFLKNLVAERLLLDKAMRLGYDQDPSIQETLARQRDSLVVRKLIDEEVRANLTVTDADVERFYKAEIDRFTTPAAARGSLGIAGTEDEARAAATAEDAQQVTITGGKVRGANLTDQVAAALNDAVMAEKPGPLTVSVEVAGANYAFDGTLTAADVKPFEAVKQQAKQLYRAQKEQEAVQALIASTLEARNVKLYPERLKTEEATP